jgi:hypothetical protein
MRSVRTPVAVANARYRTRKDIMPTRIETIEADVDGDEIILRFSDEANVQYEFSLNGGLAAGILIALMQAASKSPYRDAPERPSPTIRGRVEGSLDRTLAPR